MFMSVDYVHGWGRKGKTSGGVGGDSWREVFCRRAANENSLIFVAGKLGGTLEANEFGFPLRKVGVVKFQDSTGRIGTNSACDIAVYAVEIDSICVAIAYLINRRC